MSMISDRIPAARFVKERLGLTRGVGGLQVMARMQEWLDSEFAENPDAFTFLRLAYLGESGWRAEIVWDHHDSEIVENKSVAKHPWTAVYQVCADYLRAEERTVPTDFEQAAAIHVV